MSCTFLRVRVSAIMGLMAFSGGLPTSSLPRTFVGRWLRAAMLDDRERRDQMVGTFNGGEPGWNDDEPAVVVGCCELMLRRVWPDGLGQADIEWLSASLQAATADEKSPVRAADVEAVVRAAMRGQDERATTVSPESTTRICGIVAAVLSVINHLTDDEVTDLVTEAERVALDRGWNPPMVGTPLDPAKVGALLRPATARTWQGSGVSRPRAARRTASASKPEPIVSPAAVAAVKAAIAASVGVEFPLYRNVDEAELRAEIDSGDADHAPAAASLLGDLLQERGDVAGAIAAFRLAIDSGHPDHAPPAAVSLGGLLNEQGDVAGAMASFRLAIDSGNAEAAAAAANCLGALLQAQGDVSGAKAAYELAAGSSEDFVALAATLCLAALLSGQGDTDAAKALYQRVLDSGHTVHAPMAAGALGELLARQGHDAGAAAAYRQAVESGHPFASPVAALNLGILLAKRGDAQQAEVAYRKASASGDADVAARAAVNLGGLLEAQGNVDDARTAYRQVIGSGHTAEDIARQRLRALRSKSR